MTFSSWWTESPRVHQRGMEPSLMMSRRLGIAESSQTRAWCLVFDVSAIGNRRELSSEGSILRYRCLGDWESPRVHKRELHVSFSISRRLGIGESSQTRALMSRFRCLGDWESARVHKRELDVSFSMSRRLGIAESSVAKAPILRCRCLGDSESPRVEEKVSFSATVEGDANISSYT